MNTIDIQNGGKLGSIKHLPQNGVEIKPLTVFIGKQGTGKSLLSQLAYFFHNLPYLVSYQVALDRKDNSAQSIIRTVLDNLRSDKRAIGVFADPSVTISWEDFTIRLDQRNRQISPNKALKKYVESIISGDVPFKHGGKALFVPAERVIFSHSSRPSIWKLLSWPSTLFLYGDAVNNAAEIYSQWKDGIPNSQQGQTIYELSKEALGGEAIRYGEQWRWQIDRKTKIDIDMASSGQKANWSWLLLAEALFDQREQGLINEPFRLHIEEPEIHLHPSAQRTMMRILAYLANQGIEVLITTHSLTMLYELNNLITAAQKLPGELNDQRVPSPDFRISSQKVAAYLFSDNGNVEPLLEEKNISIDEDRTEVVSWIDEDQLRLVDEELGQELSRIRSYGAFWKE
jgi:hypothetical protein